MAYIARGSNPASQLNPLEVFGVSALFGGVWWANAYAGSQGSGRDRNSAFGTVQAAVNAAAAGDVILIAPGVFDETVTIPYAKAGLTLIGVGPIGSVAIAPSTAHAEALICHAANVSLVNLDLACPDTTTATALTVTGNGFRATDCKFEGGTNQVIFGPGTAAQATAHTAGHGGDARFTRCEFAWGTNGLVLQGTDYGAATQVAVEDCLFHDLTATHIKELVGSGGSATLTYRQLWVKGCVFDAAEDGTAATKYILLNGDNTNTGLITGNFFRVALNSGLNLVSTKAIWVGNFHPAALSTTQPS